MDFTGEQRAFVVTEFSITGSVTKVLRSYRTHFNLKRRDRVPNRKTIHRWVNKFKETGYILKNKPPGRR